MENLQYITGDLVSPWADVKMDVHDIPFEENSFDVVICNHVLEHVDDAHKVMTEFYRVMKVGGWGIFQVPIDWKRTETYEDKTITSPEEREKHFWQKDHVRLYGLDYPKKLSSVGFDVRPFDYHQYLDSSDQERFRLHKDEILFILTKP